MMCLCLRRSKQQELQREIQQAAQHVGVPPALLQASSGDLQQQHYDQQQSLQEYKQGAIEKTARSSLYSNSLQGTLSEQLPLHHPILYHTDSIPSPADMQADQKPNWTLHSSHTCPQLGPVEDVKIIFGELLGSGSFGKVYRATWAGRDVAVKVIDHTTKDLQEVQHEAELMLALQSPNVVRAYHYATYVQNEGPGLRAKARRNRSLRQLGSRPASALENGRANFGSSSGSDKSGTDLNSTASDLISALLGPAPSIVQGCRRAGSATLDKQPGSSELGAAVDVVVEEGLEEEQHELDSAPPCSVRGSMCANALAAAQAAAADAVRRAETHLVLEYCDAGTLGAFTAGWAPEPGCRDEHMLERLVLLKDVACGLEALHKQNVVHADLNARNVLVCSLDDAVFGSVAKLGDMGMSRHIKQQRTHRTTNTIGTLSHQPPEMLQHGYMSPASDVYAFGIMMWEVFTGQPAFRKLHYGQFFEAVVLYNLRPMVPQGMPADYQLLMESCWVKAPTDRPSITRVIDCLTAMIEERAVQAAAKEAAADVAEFANPCQSRVAAAVASEPAATKSKPCRNSLLALILQREASMTYQPRSGSNSFTIRSGGSITAAAAVSRSCNSDPLPPAFTVSRSSCSITGQLLGGAYGMRQPSETWLLQRSPASFSASFGTPGCFFPSTYSQLNPQSSHLASMMLTDAFTEDAFMVDSSGVEDGFESGCGGIESAAPAAAADDYFWVV